jgi:hypothetical protein
MKFHNFIKYVGMILFVNLLSFHCIKLKLKNKKDYDDEDKKMANSNGIPTIHIHVEDHDRDPVNFKRFDGERKTYSERIRELEVKYNNEKRALMQVLSFQVSKLSQLSELSASTFNLLTMLAEEKRQQKEEKAQAE